MTEEELIELLGELYPAWRDEFDCPYEATDVLEIIPDNDTGDYEELRFD